MRFQSILAVAAAIGASMVAAQNPQISKYFPPACGESCGPIVLRQRDCASGPTNYQDCLCDIKHAQKRIPLCLACIQNGFPNNDAIQPLKQMVNICELKTTTVDPNFAAATAAPMLGAGAAAVIAGLAAL